MASIEGRVRDTLFLPEPVSTAVQGRPSYIRSTFSSGDRSPHHVGLRERDYERRIPQGTPYRNQRRNQPLSTPTVRATNLGVGTGRGIYLSVEDVGRAISALRGRLTASLTWSPPPANRVSTARHPGSPWPDEPGPMSGGFEHSESWVPADRRFHYWLCLGDTKRRKRLETASFH